MFLAAGTYNLRFLATGYLPVERTVSVTRGIPAGQTIPPSPEVGMAGGDTTPQSQTVVFFDDFETNKGWTKGPNGTDTATAGLWELGDPAIDQLGRAPRSSERP